MSSLPRTPGRRKLVDKTADQTPGLFNRAGVFGTRQPSARGRGVHTTPWADRSPAVSECERRPDGLLLPMQGAVAI